MSQFKFKVETREYERGWGNKQIEVNEFDTFEDAMKFIQETNSQNTAMTAPDWYLQAEPLNFAVN